MHAHSLSQELADSSARYVICDQLADHVNVLQPILAEVVAPFLEGGQCVVDGGAGSLDDKDSVATQDVVEIGNAPNTGLLKIVSIRCGVVWRGEEVNVQTWSATDRCRREG